jgi:hypothetical protein
MAEKKVDLESFLSGAKEREMAYDWLGAAELYNTALSSLGGKDMAAAARINESRAYSLFKAAFQADRLEEFRSRMDDAVTAYRELLEAYGRITQAEAPFSAKRCEAMLAYANYWLALDQRSKRKLIGEAWDHADQALRGLEEADSQKELGATFHQLALTAALAYCHEEDFQRRESMVKSAMDHGGKAISSLETSEDRPLIAAVYVISAAFVKAFGNKFHEALFSGQFDGQAEDYWVKAAGLAEQQAFLELAHFHLLHVERQSLGFEETKGFLLKALPVCRKTRDKLLIGCVLEWLADNASWRAFGSEDRDTRQSTCEESMKHAHEAKDVYSVISHVSPVPWGDVLMEVPEAGYYANMALFDADPCMKREFAEKALDLAREALRRALNSGFPEVIMIAKDVMDHVLISLAVTESDLRRKASLLDEAITTRTESLQLLERYFPYDDWGLGWWQGALGNAKLELAELTGDPQLEEDLLKEGIRFEEAAIGFMTKASLPEDELDPVNVNCISLWRHQLIEGLHRLYDLTKRADYLRKAIEALYEAAESYRKASMHSRVAECHWKSALLLDILDEHQEAAEKFRIAADEFKNAAEKLPHLRPMYIEHSQYMLAWHEIERAKHHHSRQEHAQAKESYSRAATLHESTKKWTFLSTNYSAWAQIENAEDLSQKERSKQSIDAFGDASRLFRESETHMREHLAKIESPDEKKMVEDLMRAVDYRQELCIARTALEQARVMDKEGELGNASEKYGLAADMFARIKQAPSAEHDQKEIEMIVILSKAWKAMAKAEAESSPELYEEAAHLFDEAKNLSPGDKAKNMALGHSRLCMALGAGARYADTPESTLHAAAVQNLESAAKYYLKADLQSAAEYAKASKLLFDSYAYMNRAGSEEDQVKKTKLYAMAEKVLQASVSSYEKAGQPGRKEQVLKILAKVKEDRELAMSLVEVFLAPDIVSTTKAFSSPTPTQEGAVGLDRFEHADVQATMIAKPKELHVGQELVLEIELVNAGRGAAQLTKVEETVPKGFIVVQEPEKYRMEDSQINLRGRRLDALKTEDVRLVLKPTAKGNFRLKPRIIYLDESGTCKSCEPAPIDVVVKEMGISGWIKGT